MSNQRRNVRNVWHKLFAWMRERNDLHLDLRHANLIGAALQEVNLQGAELRHADLKHANLQDANLQHADLYEADLWNTDLRRANLRGANLQEVILQYTETTVPIGMTSNNTDVHHKLGTDTYGVGCYDGNVDEFITKTIDVRSPQQAKQIFYRCLSFGVEDHEQRFLDAIANL